jgi:hypothetical protein
VPRESVVSDPSREDQSLAVRLVILGKWEQSRVEIELAVVYSVSEYDGLKLSTNTWLSMILLSSLIQYITFGTRLNLILDFVARRV